MKLIRNLVCIQDDTKKIKDAFKECKKSFGACRKLEDKVVGTIVSCGEVGCVFFYVD